MRPQLQACTASLQMNIFTKQSSSPARHWLYSKDLHSLQISSTFRIQFFSIKGHFNIPIYFFNLDDPGVSLWKHLIFHSFLSESLFKWNAEKIYCVWDTSSSVLGSSRVEPNCAATDLFYDRARALFQMLLNRIILHWFFHFILWILGLRLQQLSLSQIFPRHSTMTSLSEAWQKWKSRYFVWIYILKSWTFTHILKL